MTLGILGDYGRPLTSHAASMEKLRAALGRLVDYERIIDEALWDQLATLGTDLLGHATGLLDALRSNTSAIRARAAEDAQLAQGWKEVLGELAQAATPEAETFREALLEAAQGAGGEEQVQALLSGGAPLFRIAARMQEEGTEGQAVFLSTHSATLSLQHRSVYLAAYHSARNMEVDPELEGELEASDADALGAVAGDLVSFTEAGLAGLHEDLVTAEPLEALRQRAVSILDEARPKAEQAGGLLGEVARRFIPEALSAPLRSSALALAEAASTLNLLVAYAAHIMGQSRGLASPSWLEEQQAAATSLPLPSQVPRGTVIAVADVPEMPAGDSVELQGIIETLEILDDPAPPKFSSFVTLRAFDGGATTRLRAHMFSLKANGLALGACCKVRGFVRTGAAWLGEGEVGLDIDRVSLTKLRKQSWVDDLTYRMRPSFTLFLDEMNLFNTPGSLVGSAAGLLAGGAACITAILVADDAAADYEEASAIHDIVARKNTMNLMRYLMCARQHEIGERATS